MKKVSYSAVVLDDKSRSKLLNHLESNIPKDFEVIAHHMTINFGELSPELKEHIGEKVNLVVKTIGFSDMAMAVGVTGFPSSNKKPHITIAVNRKEGGKPFMSNQISNWMPMQFAINLTGTVQEVGY